MRLPSPVLTAAGCGGRELAAYTDLADLGAWSPARSPSTRRPARRRRGSSRRRAACCTPPAHQNPGLQGFLATELPWYAQQGVRASCRSAAGTLAEYGELARRLGHGPGVSAVEVHLAVPDAYQTGKVLHVVRRDLPAARPCWPSGLPGGHVVDQAAAAVANGADAVVLSPGVPGARARPDTLRARCSAAGGGLLSGPAVHASRCAASGTCTPRCPTSRSSASAGSRSGFDALAHAGRRRDRRAARQRAAPRPVRRHPHPPRARDELDRRDLKCSHAAGSRTSNPKGAADDVRRPTHAARWRTGAGSASASTRTRRCSTPGG